MSTLKAEGLPPQHQPHARFRQRFNFSFSLSELSNTSKFLLCSTVISILGISYNYFLKQRKNNKITDNDLSNFGPPSLTRNLSQVPPTLARQQTSLVTDKDLNNEKILNKIITNLNEIRNPTNVNTFDINDLSKTFQQRIILICVDSSNHSCNAVLWATNNLLRKNDIVILVNVWERVNSFLSGIDNLSRSSSTEVQYNYGIELVKEMYNQYLQPEEVTCVTCLLVKEQNNKYEKNLEIAGTLLNAIKQIKPEIVVMGSRGLGNKNKTIKRNVNTLYNYEFGTVSNYVAQSIKSPVIIVPYIDDSTMGTLAQETQSQTFVVPSKVDQD